MLGYFVYGLHEVALFLEFGVFDLWGCAYP